MENNQIADEATVAWVKFRELPRVEVGERFYNNERRRFW